MSDKKLTPREKERILHEVQTDLVLEWQLRHFCWRYDFELCRMERMTKEALSKGESLPSIRLCAQNRLLDELCLKARNVMRRAPVWLSWPQWYKPHLYKTK